MKKMPLVDIVEDAGESEFLSIDAHTMDIILDSNVYLSDLRLQSNRFANFFDYVRRTRSSIILPALVRDEVLQKHREKFATQLSRVEKEMKDLCRYTMKDVRFHAPYLKNETNDLRALLRRPSNSVRTKFLASIDGVDLKEVIRRGIKRVPPASDSGEELRDVVLWLVVLDHAKSTSRPTAFVTGDRGFWKLDKPKDQISEDITSQKVDVRLYRDLPDFTKDNALVSEAVTDSWIADHVKGTVLEEIISDRLRNSLRSWRPRVEGSIQKVTTNRMEFVDGTVYKIDSKTDFAELRYRGFFNVESVTIHYLYATPPASSLTESIQAWQGLGLGGLRTGYGAELGNLVGLRNLLNPQPSSVLSGVQSRGSETVMHTYDVEAQIHISCRVEAGKTDLEVDDIEPEKISPLA